MPNKNLIAILIFAATMLFSQEAWVSRVYNKTVSIDELTDQAEFIFKVEKLSEPEDVTVTDEDGRNVKLKYVKVKILDVIKSPENVTFESKTSIKSPPPSGLHPIGDKAPVVGQTISLSDRAPLASGPPEGKSYYEYHLENAAKPKSKVALFFSRGYQETLSVFFGVIGDGLIDAQQEPALRKAMELRAYFDAVRNRKINDLKSAIKKFPKAINAVDKTWGTPLQFAARYGTKEEIDLLIKSGASLSIENSQGNPVIHDLVISGFTDNLPHIVSLTRDLNIKNKAGQTPLDLAKTGNAPGLLKAFGITVEPKKK